MTEASRFVGDIIKIRRDEIVELILRVKRNNQVGSWELWNTYYGRKIIKNIDYPHEYSLQETKRILHEFKTAGMDFEEIR